MSNTLDRVELPNGRTVKEVYENVRKEVERIYLEAWRKGISVPFFDGKGNTFLANPDGSEDLVQLDLHSRTYNIIRRTAAPGQGRFAYLCSM